MEWKLLVPILIIAIIFISGCTEETSQNATQQNQIQNITESKTTELEPTELILREEDLPENYSVMDRGETLKSDISERLANLGWKNGYYALYGNEISYFEAIGIDHHVSIFPLENIAKTIDTINTSDEELSNPNIGEKSRAFRMVSKDEFGEEEYRGYIIVFTKKDVFEYVAILGTVTDYELLRELAVKAESKIK